ncbi:hypothetical protein MPNT_200048 [Candidatus Methylacidithermus pantelleriae]|uniref:Uncharacterized protein n=1 Tax=Candidatus Methylacidithermus pantelleriae TaxID=2744239 RepID=A0A8J2BJF2_9BACT|nr:hypothetical protein MPNT_200048 [Candidatus Methylacidithermus pantelleriae]
MIENPASPRNQYLVATAYDCSSPLNRATTQVDRHDAAHVALKPAKPKRAGDRYFRPESR